MINRKEIYNNLYQEMYLKQKELTEKSLRGWKNTIREWRNCNNTWFILFLLLITITLLIILT
jgi:hypothetical protein